MTENKILFKQNPQQVLPKMVSTQGTKENIFLLL